MLANPAPMRRQSLAVQIGAIQVGGNAPIVVQSMTNTDTADIATTVAQVKMLAEAGSELVRMTVNNEEAAKAIPHIRDALHKADIFVPLIGDFHYNGHMLLKNYPECAKALDKYRINPGNVGFGQKRDKQFAEMIEVALLHEKPVRIGVNWGSLDQAVLADLLDKNARLSQPRPLGEITQEALITSALQSAEYAVSLGMPRNRIILACKVSSPPDLIAVYQSLAASCDYALHLGLTEAGMGDKGAVATTAALAVLLQQGIGDTIRASLTPRPGESRVREVLVCQEILQALHLRSFAPSITACPGCGRTTSTYFQQLTEEIQQYTRERMPQWALHYKGVEHLKVAVMGCIVNGPGESKHADIGISLPGTGESPVAPVFMNGEKAMTLRGDNIAAEFKEILEKYVAERFA